MALRAASKSSICPRPRALSKAARQKYEQAVEAHLAAIDALTAFLDEVDGDPDLEPSLGAPACVGYGGSDFKSDASTWDQTHWAEGALDDRERADDLMEGDELQGPGACSAPTVETHQRRKCPMSKQSRLRSIKSASQSNAIERNAAGRVSLEHARSDASAGDPAVEIAMQIVRLETRFNELDAASVSPDARQDALLSANIFREFDEIHQRLEICRDYLSLVNCTSIAGAAAQLRQLNSLFDPDLEYDEQEQKRRDLKISRLCYSIDSALRRVIGEDMSRKIGLMEPSLNPSMSYHERYRRRSQ